MSLVRVLLSTARIPKWDVEDSWPGYLKIDEHMSQQSETQVKEGEAEKDLKVVGICNLEKQGGQEGKRQNDLKGNYLKYSKLL